jgi:hypothetical protein
MMMVNREIWSARLPNGEVRSGSLEQLSEAWRAGYVDGSTMVRSAGSAQWKTLSDVVAAAEANRAASVTRAARSSAPPPQASQPPPAASLPPQPVSQPLPQASQPPAPASVSAAPDLIQVRLADGQVRSGTQEQLVEALRAGHLDEKVLVLAAGATAWVPLGSLLAGEPPPAPPAPPLEVAVALAAPPPEPPSPVASEESSSVGDAPAEEPGGAADSFTAGEDAPTPAQPAVHNGDEAQASEAASSGEAYWHIRLTDTQLQEAFRWLDDDAPVLAAGSDQWMRLGDLRRSIDPSSSEQT